MPTKKASKRPPKGWIDRCIASVKAGARRFKRSVRDPGGVCGETWYHRMTGAERKQAKKKYPN